MEQLKEQSTAPTSSTPEKRENMWINFGVNILIPILILRKGEDWLPFFSPALVLTVALLFPVLYFFYDLFQRRSYNFISILGFVSILLTGGIGLLQLNPVWIAVKEAALPAVIGLAVLLSSRTKYPLVHKFLYNKELIEVDKIDQALESRGNRASFEQLLMSCTWILAASFLLSAILNFILARIIVTTDPAIDAVLFNKEIGSLNAWSMAVIVLPCMLFTGFALWKLFAGIKELTGLGLEEVFKQPEKS